MDVKKFSFFSYESAASKIDALGVRLTIYLFVMIYCPSSLLIDNLTINSIGLSFDYFLQERLGKNVLQERS